jgi:hypothetical protein
MAPQIYDIRRAADAAHFGLALDERDRLLSKHYPNRRGSTPRIIVLHIQQGWTRGSLDHHANVVRASANIYANQDGSLVRGIADEDGPWTNGDTIWMNERGKAITDQFGPDPNFYTLSIEAEGISGTELSQEQIDAIVWQVRQWMREYDIPLSRVVRHADFNSHPDDRITRDFCPGSYYERVIRILGEDQPIQFVRFSAPRIIRVRNGVVATARRGPSTGEEIVEQFSPGTDLEFDGFFHGEEVERSDRWLRLSEAPHLAIHASGLDEGAVDLPDVDLIPRVGSPTGPIQTAAPWGAFGFTWERLNQWDSLVLWAANEFGTPRGIADLAPVMKAMMAIESGGRMYNDRGHVITRDDGFGDGLSVGLLQVKPSIWQALVADADAYTPAGNIRLGTAIMAQAIQQHGSWEKALTRVFFPSDDPNGVTQNEYVAAVRGLIAEMGPFGLLPEPEFVPFPESRVFTVAPDRQATGRRGPRLGAEWFRDFAPGEAIRCDGFYLGEAVEGENRWLRTSGTRRLAIHKSGLVEDI